MTTGGTSLVKTTRHGLRHVSGDRCQKCNSVMLYEDYDPWHSHHGWTCGACGFEQVLDNGTKSLIDPTKRYTGLRLMLAGAYGS